MNENILALVRAGFSADEIRIIAPEAFAMPSAEPSVISNGAPEQTIAPAAPAEPAAAPAAPAQSAAAPAQPAVPPEPEAAPSWFAEYERQHNAQIAQLQRALQVQNVQTADQPNANIKSQEDLMKEAFLSIVN